MKKIVTAIALMVALPSAAFAQPSAAPAAGKMQGMNMQNMNMQSMKMSGKKMSGMKMQHMSCKDMQAMMAKGRSMHMSRARMARMCPRSSKSVQKAGVSKARGHRH